MNNNRETTITIKDNAYKVTYPTTGDQIDIELMKARIANGNYDELRLSRNPVFTAQADIIDMVATFSIMIKKLKEDMNVKSFFDLQEDQTHDLMDAYEQQYLPWYIQIKTEIQNARKPKVEEHRDQPAQK